MLLVIIYIEVIILIENFGIAGYCRISVDEEQDRDNTSIENQKAIIEDFVKKHFPSSTLTFYEDRDKSGYTFEQREGYQLMRRELISHKKDILIVKDFSRFSRRNSRGLVELEDLRDVGCRIISIGDNIDFPNDDDWLKIQFQFLINEMPVTDTSKKVKSVIKRRQADANWICAAPYGYIINKKGQFELVPEQAEVIRKVFELYIDGWGYKKIANYLTDEKIPTPRMDEKARKEAQGEQCNHKAKPEWSIITIQGILDNDFYIGTLRQGKFTRKKINGADMKKDESDHIVFENHHQAIIDYRTFRTAKAQREQRTKSNYRGVKVYDNVYSGLLSCGDCGAPMFAMSRSDLKDAYRCGTYHRRGLKGCTSHHIRVEKLDELIKEYVKLVMNNSADIIERLNTNLENERDDIKETEISAENLAVILADLQEEMKATKRQRIRDIMKHPEQEALLEETYDELESDLAKRIEGLQNQIALTENKRNTIIQVNRIAKTAMDVFADILAKPKLDKADLELIIKGIKVFEDHIEIDLQADIDDIIRCGMFSEEDEKQVVGVNFNIGTEDSSKNEKTIVQSSNKRKDKVFRVNVISGGDPLEIFTNNNGEVIFKKYSPIGELGKFAEDYADVLAKTSGFPAIICDRDHVIAATGIAKKEILNRRISINLEDIVDERKGYFAMDSEPPLLPVEGAEHLALVQSPILSAGDICGSALLLKNSPKDKASEAEAKLIVAAATFLGKQMEQ